jgi:hypothetical protein
MVSKWKIFPNPIDGCPFPIHSSIQNSLLPARPFPPPPLGAPPPITRLMMNNMGDGGIGKAEEDSNGMTFFPILAHIDSPKKWTTNSFYYSENKIQKWMKYSLIRMDMPQWPLNVNEATIRALEEGKRGMNCFVIVGWNKYPIPTHN